MMDPNQTCKIFLDQLKKWHEVWSDILEQSEGDIQTCFKNLHMLVWPIFAFLAGYNQFQPISQNDPYHCDT